MNWASLPYWDSGEYQVVQDNLGDLTYDKIPFCPERRNMFKALRATPYDKVKVAIVGQDPYPNRDHATGIAFSVPTSCTVYPPTLRNIYLEYKNDLKYPDPPSGDLGKWCEQGVLLWNAYPTCLAGQPNSHHWPEWELLTRQILEELDKKPVVFVFLGGAAGLMSKYTTGACVFTSHPSPLGARSGKHPFLGSRLFTTINTKLIEIGLTPVDWRLDNVDQPLAVAAPRQVLATA